MKATAKPKSKAPSQRSLRRKFLAEQKPTAQAPLQRLSDEESTRLYDLIDDANESNHRLLRHASSLDAARDALDQAKKNVEEAEATLAATRAENQRIHAEMAPLFHRLPA